MTGTTIKTAKQMKINKAKLLFLFTLHLLIYSCCLNYCQPTPSITSPQLDGTNCVAQFYLFSEFYASVNVIQIALFVNNGIPKAVRQGV